jgi:hypothetical protein
MKKRNGVIYLRCGVAFCKTLYVGEYHTKKSYRIDKEKFNFIPDRYSNNTLTFSSKNCYKFLIAVM